jgi:class 3 adenylate cyclase/sugar phosphate isomerase/epimerase
VAVLHEKISNTKTITVIKTIKQITVETMTDDELKTKVEELEALIKTGNDYAQAETQARELLAEDALVNKPELHCRILLAFSESLWRRGMAQDALSFSEQALTITEQIESKELQAKALGNIGAGHGNLSDYALALEYYGKALALDEELGNKAGVAAWLGNIGLVHTNLSDYARALEYYGKALTLEEELGNKAGVANNLGNIGTVHRNLSDYSRALEYYGKALALDEALGNKVGVANNLGNIGTVYASLSDYTRALEYFGKALTLAEELGNKKGVAVCLGNIGETYTKQHFDGYNPDKAEEYLLLAIDLITEIGYKAALIEFHKTLSELYEQEQRLGDAFTHFKKYIAIKEEVNVEEVKKQESIREQRRQAAEREKEIEIERTRATAEKRILNNILPEEITQRLIKGENPIADTFDCVSVLFMDIVDFTKLSTTISAQQLVHLLNAIFSSADGVMREFGLEKIKTIGDAYMAVAGAPIVQEDHAQRAANAAVKLLDVMKNLEVSFPDSLGDKSWIASLPEIHVRIGVHCGPAAAGVVGENKFLYDLWGDAVNTASRMESHGEAGKIHVTEEFKHAVETVHEPSLRFIPRGEMDIKGKGRMKTYYLQKATL